MNIIGEKDIDIKIDENGQPVRSKTGDFQTVEGDDCWKQDLNLEAGTDEGELFYENEEGEAAYGFGMLDFMQAEDDELTRLEVSQRVSSKLKKRTYLDEGKTKQEIDYKDGKYIDKVTIFKNEKNFVLELNAEEMEVAEE